MKKFFTILYCNISLCLNTYADEVSLKGIFIPDISRTIKWMVNNNHHSIRNENDIERLTKALSAGDPLMHQWTDGKLTSIITNDWKQDYNPKWKKTDDTTYLSKKPKDENNTEMIYTLKIQDQDNYYLEVIVNEKTTREYFIRKTDKPTKMENKRK